MKINLFRMDCVIHSWTNSISNGYNSIHINKRPTAVTLKYKYSYIILREYMSLLIYVAKIHLKNDIRIAKGHFFFIIVISMCNILTLVSMK
jgi:hypothetical protein